jgi:hypothetical protein
MKLIYCPQCYDVIKLLVNLNRECACGKASGYYLSDGYHCVIKGDAIPIGFANSSFTQALENRPKEGIGFRFEAFVIPVKCSTVKVA